MAPQAAVAMATYSQSTPHEFHENCHSITFYFMKKDSTNDAVTPQRQSQFKLILYILFYVLFYKIITDYIFVTFDVKYLIVFGDDNHDMNIHYLVNKTISYSYLYSHRR